MLTCAFFYFFIIRWFLRILGSEFILWVSGGKMLLFGFLLSRVVFTCLLFLVSNAFFGVFPGFQSFFFRWFLGLFFSYRGLDVGVFVYFEPCGVYFIFYFYLNIQWFRLISGFIFEVQGLDVGFWAYVGRWSCYPLVLILSLCVFIPNGFWGAFRVYFLVSGGWMLVLGFILRLTVFSSFFYYFYIRCFFGMLSRFIFDCLGAG